MSAAANIVVAGQSGQGVIMVSKVLVEGLHRAGLPVAATEYPAITHRFAITFAHIRTGADAATPRIRPREASLIIGLEPFECLRASLLFAQPDTEIVVSDTFIRIDGEPNHLLKDPIAVKTVDDVVTALSDRGLRRVTPVRATRIALDKVTNRAGANMVLLGVAFASGRIPAEQATLEEVIAEFAPRNTGSLNCEGFRAGIDAYRTFSEERG
jgi:Pyruvate/2-oxoacid:ferredoxin oxidoreductase gamma subunit